MARIAFAITLLACVAAAVAQGMPPPGVAPTSAPTAKPTMKPTKPTVKPTPKKPTVKKPTVKPTPRCIAGPVGTYLDKKTKTCNACSSKSSPFRSTRGRLACYPPATGTTSSTVCTDAVLPALIQSNADASKTVSCINPNKVRSVIFLPLKSTAYPFINAGVYTKAALRLNDSIVAVRNGGVFLAGTVKIKGVSRYQVVFDDRFGTLKKKRGKVVRVSGVLRRGNTKIDYCFVAYVKVC